MMSSVEEPAQEGGPELSLLEHLNELRIRITWAAVGLFIATVFSFVFAEQILAFLLSPYSRSVENATLQTLRPTEGIETFFKVALLSGVILSMPYILYQLWLFISPGLKREERRYVYIFIPSALALFLTGIAFAWFVLAPSAIFFLANFLPDIFKTDWTGQEYISFMITLLFWLGISFEMPVIIYFLSRLGLLSSGTLRQQWRIAIVAIAVLAAAITPSIDPITMLLTMAPLLLLYLLSIALARLGYRQFERSMAVDSSA